MLTYDLTKRGKLPLYEYLYSCIRQDIIGGYLKPGEKLPSKRSLARHLNVGLITVANAYEQLQMEGYITARERQGFFVENVSGYMQKPEQKRQTPTEPQEPQFAVDFKANLNSLNLFPTATWSHFMHEALALRNRELFRTTPYNGLYVLRKAIADYLKRTRGMDVVPEQIIIGAGTEYLYSRLMQMFGPSYSFAIEDPGYKKFAVISASHGNAWHYVPIDEAGIMIDALEESGADIVHVSPANHFPTGIIMPVTRRLELFEWVNRIRKRYIIEDDYDSEFRYSGRLALPLYTQDVMNKVIYLNTFSKSMVPSLRISYMVLPQKLLQLYRDSMSFYSCTVSSFEQYALARFIDEGHLERHINRMRKFYGEQRTAILNAIKNSPLGAIANVIERNAGTHFLLRVHTSLSEKEIIDAGLRRSMLLSMYSDYSNAPLEGAPVLIINYAGIEPGKISEVVQTLSDIFPETKK